MEADAGRYESSAALNGQSVLFVEYSEQICNYRTILSPTELDRNLSVLWNSSVS
jgi:hypothetical protein